MSQPQYTPVSLPRRPISRSGHQSALKIIGAIFALMLAALLGLIVLLLIGAETGPIELIIGMVCATLPVPIYIVLLLWIDRYESEPLWMLTTAFLWGALVAVFIAFILNTINGAIVTAATNSAQVGENFGAVISAPIVEESAKAFILLVLFLWKRDEFDGIVDGIIYAGMAGLGFAMTENILYYGRAVGGGAGVLTFTFILRGMAAPFSHPLFTSMTGIGLGWSRQSNNGFVKVVAPVLGFMLAIVLHATWNGTATYGGAAGFFAGYFLIMGPAFIITLMVIFFSLRREGRIVRQFLYPDYQRGFFDPVEYEKLSTIHGRMGMSWTAMMTRGFFGWRARMRYNQIASELAFHRSRVARGFIRDPNVAREREDDYLYTLQELRQKFAVQMSRGAR
ncbi:MAG TPA: PrsW family intramembrane metalloprotease [Pyrinomonadaceae bacterium]|jgi:RsiW-degrading membrane proteinase PrsW (M82 family)|nr:PrsW family intramembrane metalloprotease [Pyrinomonadaceae bacterium]